MIARKDLVTDFTSARLPAQQIGWMTHDFHRELGLIPLGSTDTVWASVDMQIQETVVYQ